MKEIYLVSTVCVPVSDDAPSQLEEMLAYISQHCDDASLTSTAAFFHVHPNTVSGLIKRHTGKTYGELVREMRMSRALALLKSCKINVAQISRLCGYDNASNFYRVFKQHFGITPRAYIEKYHAQQQSGRQSAGQPGAQFGQPGQSDAQLGRPGKQSATGALLDSDGILGEANRPA